LSVGQSLLKEEESPLGTSRNRKEGDVGNEDYFIGIRHHYIVYVLHSSMENEISQGEARLGTIGLVIYECTSIAIILKSRHDRCDRHFRLHNN
jgi:hypothetical protein